MRIKLMRNFEFLRHFKDIYSFFSCTNINKVGTYSITKKKKILSHSLLAILGMWTCNLQFVLIFSFLLCLERNAKC